MPRLAAVLGVVFVLAAIVCGARAYTGIGDRLLRTYFIFSPMPINSSEAQSWYQIGDCVPGLGTQYTVKSGGPTKSNPMSVYISAGGQVSAFGISVYGPPPAAQTQFWSDAGDHYDIIIGTRSSGDPCDSSMTWDEEVGDQLAVNPTGGAYQIPLTSDDAANQGWISGGCINKMGRHWGLTLDGSSSITSSANLFPFLPMYNEDTGNISAVLLQTTDSVIVEPFGDFEAFFPSALFCMNFCGNCSIADAPVATLHTFFTDPSDNSCSSRC